MANAETLRPLLKPWLSALRSRSEATARNYRVAVSRFLDELGDRELDVEAVGDFLDSLDGLAPGSRAAYISAVRSFLKVAQDQGLIEKSPRELLIRPRVTVTSFGRYLSLEEMRRLLEAAEKLSPAHRAVVLLMWSTGIRVGELAKAEWRDLYRDPSGRLGLRIVHGKGGKERVAKVLDETFDALAALHGSSELDPSDRTPLVPGKHSNWSIWRYVKDSVEAAGLAATVSPHWLRHSFGTWSAHGGASAFEIAFAMGHSRLETSQRYVHQATGLARTATDFLPEL